MDSKIGDVKMLMDADVDIDFADRDQILQLIKYTSARQESNKESKRHNSGIYVTDIPTDPLHKCASIDYKEAEDRGYFKIDFLNVSVYQHIKNSADYDDLLSIPPPWKKLLDRSFNSQVIHIANHHSVLVQTKPDSIPRMAMFLALIRPAKRHLIGKSWVEIAEEIWTKPPGNEYYFKKAHAVSYAVLVALHMNIIHRGL
jgi:hypothetical protein